MPSSEPELARIYLDNAATSWPKPPAVYDAVDHYLRHCGIAAGRGTYRGAVEVRRKIEAARQGIAVLLGVNESRRIIWTANATDSLNLALHGFLRDGDHVVTSDIEHNSVLRPLRNLQTRRGVRVDYVACDAAGYVDADAVEAAFTPRTRLVVVNHASNVTGAIQPLAEIAARAAARGVCVLVDAAQTMGQVPWPAIVNPRLLVAGAGHKSLLGPLGLGWLYVAPGLERELEPVRQGGTGTVSEDDRQPDSLPDRYESGNLNVPAIVGLAAGLEYIQQRGVVEIADHHRRCVEQLRERLASIPGVTVFGPSRGQPSVGVVSCLLDGFDAHELAAMLDGSFGIQTRAGLHCAPRIHRALGTLSQGGTLRLSIGCFTTDAEIETTIQALTSLSAS